MARKARDSRAKIEIRRAREFIAPTTQNYGFVPDPKKSKGCWVWNIDGEKYFDAHSGPGVFNIGHKHPKFVAAMCEGIYKMFGFGANEYPNRESNDLAEKLISISPGNFKKRVFFCSSGTESVEAAIRAAQIHRLTPTMMAFEKTFHGRTSGARTLTDRAHVTKYSYPAFPVIRLPFPEEGSEMGDPLIFMKHVRRMLSAVNLGEVAALFWEPIQGEGGIRITSRPAFKALMDEIIAPKKILLVADEVQTFSRTGKWFAAEHYDVEPDIICLAKALGGGAPIGATIMRSEVCWPEGGLYSNTFGGNPFCSACALKTLEIMEKENLITRAENLGELFHQKFYKAASSGCVDLYTTHYVSTSGVAIYIVSGGLGLMRKIVFSKFGNNEPVPEFRDRVKEEAFRRRILLMPAGDSALRIMPPLVVSEQEIKWLANELAEAIIAVVKTG